MGPFLGIIAMKTLKVYAKDIIEVFNVSQHFVNALRAGRLFIFQFDWR